MTKIYLLTVLLIANLMAKNIEAKEKSLYEKEKSHHIELWDQAINSKNKLRLRKKIVINQDKDKIEFKETPSYKKEKSYHIELWEQPKNKPWLRKKITTKQDQYNKGISSNKNDEETIQGFAIEFK